MTNQDIFTKVYLHLLKQGAAALQDGCCSYRGDNETSCAVGCLISDDLYELVIEGIPIAALPIEEKLFDDPENTLGRSHHVLHHILKSSGINVQQYCLLDALQAAHDSQLKCHGVERWKAQMAVIAQEYGLQIPEVE